MFSKKIQRFVLIMRIAVNTRFLLPNRLEGIGYFTQEISRRLVARRPNDEFLFLFDRPYDPSFVWAPNVRPLVVPPPARHPFLWYLWFELSLPLVLARWQPDVFFSPDGYCSLRSRVPTFMVSHDIAHLHYPAQIPWLARQYYHHFVPRYLQRAQQLGTVSEFSRQDIIGHYGISSDKISVVPNGIKPDFVPLSEEARQAVRNRVSGGKPYFFYVGAIHPRKNLPRLIAAYDRFRAQGRTAVPLLIAGRFAWQTGEVHSAWQSAQYREDIHFLGYVPEQELPSLVGAALGLVYVSLFEGFGVPVLEAMQADVPVIASNLSSIPEVAGDAALLVDPLSVPDMANALTTLEADALLRQELIRKGRSQYPKFSWEIATDKVEEGLLKARLSCC